MLFLSDISEDQFYDDLHPQTSLWTHLVKDVCSLNGIESQQVRPFSDGVNLVACVNEKFVVKIFPPFHMHQWKSDFRTLKHLQNTLSLPIPEYVNSGELENSWTYLVMSKLEGVSLEKVWVNISLENKIRIMHHIGRTIAETHAVPAGELANLDPDWHQFIAGQARGCKKRHEKKGMPQWFIEGLESWIEDSMPLLNTKFNSVVLTGEYTPFNLLINQDQEDSKLSGMIDFGDTMIGFSEYDLLGPSVFLGSGNPDLIRALFDGYGYKFGEDIYTIQRRLLLLQILHRYSDFRSQLRIDNWEYRVKSFDDLAKIIWPL